MIGQEEAPALRAGEAFDGEANPRIALTLLFTSFAPAAAEKNHCNEKESEAQWLSLLTEHHKDYDLHTRVRCGSDSVWKSSKVF